MKSDQPENKNTRSVCKMYNLKKRMEISGAHQLKLNYESPCNNLHGHGWIIEVYCKSDTLNENGMIVDFKEIKTKVHDVLDHHYINDVIGDMNPTAENMAKWICERVPHCYKVSVQETEGNIAIYEVDE